MNIESITKTPTTILVKVLCPYCNKKHTHGGQGYRAAHCGKGEYLIDISQKVKL